MQPTPFAGGRRARPWRLRTAGTSVLAVVAVLAASLGVVGMAGPASAAVPTFPDNILVFPNRDLSWSGRRSRTRCSPAPSTP